MPDLLEYIDDYFQNALSDRERKVFEERCVQDETFAKEVAFYITARQTIQEELLANKQSAWKKEEDDAGAKNIPIIPAAKKINRSTWIRYAAAACLIIAAGIYFWIGTTSPNAMAKRYVSKDLAHISMTMDGVTDSIHLGIAAYNQKEYDKALLYFERIANTHPENNDAKKYAGLVYLVKEDYDKALDQFTKLADTKGLFSNPGNFLKAITLLLRNNENDTEKAKQLLQKVVDDNEEGWQKAQEWLAKW